MLNLFYVFLIKFLILLYMARKVRSKKFLVPNENAKKLRRRTSRTKRHVLQVKNGGGCCGGNCQKSRKRNIGPRPLKSSRRRMRRN